MHKNDTFLAVILLANTKIIFKMEKKTGKSINRRTNKKDKKVIEGKEKHRLPFVYKYSLPCFLQSFHGCHVSVNHSLANSKMTIEKIMITYIAYAYKQGGEESG